MKALTICQPYAELIARGLKPIENRTWPTDYRGPLAIHAGKSRTWMDDGDLEAYPDMAFGAVVAIVRVIDCQRVEDLPVHLRHHQHANGPWCWVLEHLRRLDPPVPYRGAQGLWNFDLAHRWTRDDPRWPSLSGLTFCDVCGVVQRGDGRNKSCSGVTPRISFREDTQRTGEVDARASGRE